MTFQVNCRCGHIYNVDVYRTIWGEYPENRELVMQDKINVYTCPVCGFSFKGDTALMYVDAKKGFAVWWEPTHDPQIDKEIPLYDASMGKGNYYSTAPRVKNWEEFKSTIIKFENSELNTSRPTKMFGIDIKDLFRKK